MFLTVVVAVTDILLALWDLKCKSLSVATLNRLHPAFELVSM